MDFILRHNKEILIIMYIYVKSFKNKCLVAVMPVLKLTPHNKQYTVCNVSLYLICLFK